MSDLETPESEYRLEQLIGNLLRAGVLLAGAVVLVGGVAHMIGHAGEIPDYQTFRGEPEALRSVLLIIRDAWSFQSTAVIELGLLLLIATPVARVFLAVVGFALARDKLYAIVASIVLLILVASLTGYI
jgi:uncharacterized membrane protein